MCCILDSNGTSFALLGSSWHPGIPRTGRSPGQCDSNWQYFGAYANNTFIGLIVVCCRALKEMQDHLGLLGPKVTRQVKHVQMHIIKNDP